MGDFKPFLEPPKSPIMGDFKPFLDSKSPRMGDLGGGSGRCLSLQTVSKIPDLFEKSGICRAYEAAACRSFAALITSSEMLPGQGA
jgi:hypothetical protein